ncbi:hypothetical protein ACHAXS_013202 [Conticribra weissflogii]
MCKPTVANGAASTPSARKRVAVIGGGVTGLAAAWHLHTQSKRGQGGRGDDEVEVHVFEAADRLGGHAHTLRLNTENFSCRDLAENQDDDNKTATNNNDEVDIDCGFMVYNPSNYPNMTEWFSALSVEPEPSDMSLSISLDGGNTVEWSSTSLSGLLANPAQLFDSKFYSFFRDMVRFHSRAGNLLLLPENDPKRQVTMGEYLRNEGYGEGLASYYLVPMMAALWSASVEDVMKFPAVSLVEFMCNHRMLQLFDRPLWNTPAGRSIQYVHKMATLLAKNAHTSTPILSMNKKPKGPSIVDSDNDNSFTYELFTTDNTSVGTFDHVVFACHPPVAHQILSKCNATNSSGTIDAELLANLNKIQYGDNVVYIHSDPKLMPKRKSAWASWNCMGKSRYLTTHLRHVSGNDSAEKNEKAIKREAMEGSASGFGARLDEDKEVTKDVNGGVVDETHRLEGENGRMRAVYVTYHINRLQNLSTPRDIFVSLNPHQRPDSQLVYRRQIMSHPQFTRETLAGRKAIKEEYQGKDGLWFCGAWMGYGFHEDGCRSGFEVATAINGVPLPWVQEKKENDDAALMVLPPPDLAKFTYQQNNGFFRRLKHLLSYRIPVAICKVFVTSFLKGAITKGELRLRLNDGTTLSFGDKSEVGGDDQPVTARIFDDWFFVKVATEYDLGLARSYMAGQFVVEPLEARQKYHWSLCPAGSRDETNDVIGDPIGLTRLFLLFVGNRDLASIGARRSAKQHTYANALQNASGLAISKIGSFLNYLRFKITMDNSERGGSLKNIHAHYDISNDLFRTFLDKETLMYSSAIYDAVAAPTVLKNGVPRPSAGLVFKGSLEEAQWRKLDTLLDRAQIQPGQSMLDIGFGWGGLSLHAARKYGCRVHGITLSVEQKALAETRVENEGLGHLITFEVIDYRTFARKKENQGRFDRVISCEMIEAVGHEHLGEFFWAVEQVLKHDGVLVMEAITTPEARYETYLRSTDFINTIIFPGSLCPSLHALVDASYKWSTLTLEHIDNIGLHYAETLAEWRRRFNAKEPVVRKLGFDDVFMRVWNYYLTYCEAGFRSQTENCLILVFSRPGNRALVPLTETRSVTQLKSLTKEEVNAWLEG